MFEAEIERGAKLLDRDDPGWALESARRPISLEGLNMRWGFSCILGQHGGGYAAEAVRLGFNTKSLEEYGFTVEDVDALKEFERLTAEWRTFIRKRRKDARSKKA